MAQRQLRATLTDDDGEPIGFVLTEENIVDLEEVLSAV
jgi:hypothetical protein